MGKIVRQFIPPTDVSGCNGVEASSDRPIGAHDVHLSLALECGMRPSGKWPRSPQQGLLALVEPQVATLDVWLGCLIRNPKLHHRLEVRLDLLLILPVPQPVVHGLHVAADRGGRHGPVLLRLAISLRKQRVFFGLKL